MRKNEKEYIVHTKHGTYAVRIWRNERENVYSVRIQAFPELATFGTSLADAKRMAKDIIQLHCDCLIKEGKLVVDDSRRVAGNVPKSRVLTPA